MNKKTLITILVVAVMLLAAAGLWMLYLGNNRASELTTTPTTEPQNTDETQDPQASNQQMEIVYTDNGFDPSELTVTAGEEIRIVNQSSSPLEFSSDAHPTHTDNHELNTETLQPGEETIITITETGTWGFHNHLRANDTGSVIVVE